jgi:hypothetical protein
VNKTVYTKIFLKELGEGLSDAALSQYMPIWWQNTRNKDSGGLRLTEEGFNIINKIGIVTYEISFPLDMNLTTQVIIFLDKFIDCPYYFNKKGIFVTNEKKAVELALFSGDIRKYGIAKALKRSEDLKKDG